MDSHSYRLLGKYCLIKRHYMYRVFWKNCIFSISTATNIYQYIAARYLNAMGVYCHFHWHWPFSERPIATNCWQSRGGGKILKVRFSPKTSCLYSVAAGWCTCSEKGSVGEEGGGGLYLSLQIYKTLFLIKWFIMMYIYIYICRKRLYNRYIYWT